MGISFESMAWRTHTVTCPVDLCGLGWFHPVSHVGRQVRRPHSWPSSQRGCALLEGVFTATACVVIFFWRINRRTKFLGFSIWLVSQLCYIDLKKKKSLHFSGKESPESLSIPYTLEGWLERLTLPAAIVASLKETQPQHELSSLYLHSDFTSGFLQSFLSGCLIHLSFLCLASPYRRDWI